MAVWNCANSVGAFFSRIEAAFLTTAAGGTENSVAAPVTAERSCRLSSVSHTGLSFVRGRRREHCPMGVSRSRTKPFQGERTICRPPCRFDMSRTLSHTSGGHTPFLENEQACIRSVRNLFDHRSRCLCARVSRGRAGISASDERGHVPHKGRGILARRNKPLAIDRKLQGAQAAAMGFDSA